MTNETSKLCDWCGEHPADHRYREVVGITFRSSTTGGGSNYLVGRRDTGRVPCSDCFRKIRDGVPIGQGSLL